MSGNELHIALEALPTALIQRLVDQLEANRDMDVTVSNWRRCPMTIAGVNRLLIAEDGPEHRCVDAWDSYALPGARTPWRDRLCARSSQTASGPDVEALLRLANAALASRSATQAAIHADELTARERAELIAQAVTGPTASRVAESAPR